MTSKPTIALCIPAYNAAMFLPSLLDSAKNQSIPFDEILVYNDCSTDETLKIAKESCNTVIEGKINSGCSIGKNKLAEIAKSDWLHFHDADDLLLPNFTEVTHRWIAKPDAPDIILLHYYYKNFATGESLGEPEYKREDIKKDTVKFTIDKKIVNFAIIRKSSFLKIGGFDTDPKVLYNEDRAFYTKASIAGLSFDYEPEATCINYLYSNSMSVNNRAKCARATLQVLENVINKTNNKYNAEIATQLLDNANYAATASDWGTVNKSVKMARSIYPKQVPAGSKYFRALYKIIPYYAYFIREILIRYFTRKRKANN